MASFLRTTLLGTARHRIATRLRNQALASLLTGKELEWFQNETMHGKNDNLDVNGDKDRSIDYSTGLSPGALTDVFRDDVAKVSSALTTTVANILRSSSSVIFRTYHMLSLDPALFGVAFTVVPAMGVAAMVLRKDIKRITTRQREMAAQMASCVEERLTLITMVKMSNR